MQIRSLDQHAPTKLMMFGCRRDEVSKISARKARALSTLTLLIYRSVFRPQTRTKGAKARSYRIHLPFGVQAMQRRTLPPKTE